MRAGIIRSDLGKGVYISDIDSRSQYPYASVVGGQSRTLRRPADSEILDLVKANPLPVAITGLNTSTAVDSRLATGLSVKASAGGTYSTIPIGPTAAAQKTYIAAQLNSGFASAGLPLSASVVGVNQIRITTSRTGEDAYVAIQGSGGNSGSLNFVLGMAAGAFAGPAQATLAAALLASVYTGQRFDVGSGAISAAGYTVNTGAPVNYGLLGSGFADFKETVADLVAPELVAGGDVLLSVAQGVMSKLRDPNFYYDGVTGAALYVTGDDGTTPFTYP